MGFLKPPKPTPPVITPPPEKPPLSDDLSDPDAVNNSRKRANAARRRQGRSKLRIPLSTSAGSAGGSGLSISG